MQNYRHAKERGEGWKMLLFHKNIGPSVGHPNTHWLCVTHTREQVVRAPSQTKAEN